MRLRALFVSAVAVVTALALIGPAAASYRSSGGSHGSHGWSHGKWTTGPAPISGVIGAEDDEPDALRYVGHPAPPGFSDEYQHADPFIATFPEDGTVRFEGTLVLSGRMNNTVAAIGLVEKSTLKSGGTARNTGALIYLFSRDDGSFRIGLTDGRDGGEIVQRAIDFPSGGVPDSVDIVFTVNGEANPASCASHGSDVPTATGCMMLTVNDGGPIGDSYGTIKEAVLDEFAEGAVPGWEMFAGDNSKITYDLTIDPAKTRSAKPRKPKSKKDCKNGGWQDYWFRNQGQCIKWVIKHRRHHHPRHHHGRHHHQHSGHWHHKAKWAASDHYGHWR